MTLKQLQEQIAGMLNADAWLSQRGCRAFAEDSQTVVADVATHLQQAGGVAAVVLTPSGEMAGLDGDGMNVSIDSLTIQFVELPELNRLDKAHATALQAAQHVALRLNQPGIEFQRFTQTSDAQTGSVTASCVFSTHVTLTDGE